MAVRADRPEILGGVDRPFSTGSGKRLEMVDMDESLSDGTIPFAHQDAADAAGAPPVPQAGIPSRRISLIGVHGHGADGSLDVA